MKKLTQKEAADLYIKVQKEVKETKGYREGQSLYNNLPSDIAIEINGTDLDFFHWKDGNKVWGTFYNNLVEEDPCWL